MYNSEFHTVRGYQLLEQNEKLLTSAMEDYLEMISRNSLKEGYLRINKLAELLNVKASSASKMVQKLGELELLKYEKYGIIILTENGKEIGKFLLSRHNIIENFLKTIGINKNLLVETELIEHNMILSILLDTFFSNFAGFYYLYNQPSSQSENYDAVLVYNGTKRSKYHYIPVRRPAATSYAAIAFNPS